MRDGAANSKYAKDEFIEPDAGDLDRWTFGKLGASGSSDVVGDDQ